MSPPRRRGGSIVLAAFVVLVGVARAAETPPPLVHEWRLLEGKYLQIAAPPGEDPAVTDAREGTRGACLAGMVEVRGDMKIDTGGSIEELQKTTCVDWIDRNFPERCGRFDEGAWRKIASKMRVRPMHFCMDRFEYPNRLGEYPIIVVTWPEASAMCGAQGKRLCTEDEWTFACEGEEAMPYPHGYERDAKACVIDRAWRGVDERALGQRGSEKAQRAIDRLWQGTASGSSPRCRSPFGVYDMTGNVDEWTRSVRSGGLRSILKGGYWGPVRTRCRPTTRAHGEEFAYYQEGFRCCADRPAGAP